MFKAAKVLPSIPPFVRQSALVASLAVGIALASVAPTQAQQSPDYTKHVLKSDFMKFPANAIAIGKHGPNKGKIIGATAMFNEIMVMDPDTGTILRRYGQPDYPVAGCDDVTEGPDGTLYWSNALSGTIGYLKPDGTTGEFEGIGFVNGIAVSADGKWLMYSAAIGKDELWRLELGEDGLPKEGGIREMVQAQPGWSNSMDGAPDGKIYAPTNYYGEIRALTPETGDVEVVWEGLEFPSAVDVNDATGILYATEFHHGFITKIDLETQYSRVIGRFPPFTDNVASTDDRRYPRVFGSSFVADHIYEVYENGDDPRLVSAGGLVFESIETLGNRVFIKDMGRVMEYKPKSGAYESFAWGNFWLYADGESHDWGPQRYNPDRINWTHSYGPDELNTGFGKVGRLTADGKRMIIAGEMAEWLPNRLGIIDLETRVSLRDIMDLPHIEDVVEVGDDLYLIAKNIPEMLRGPVNGPNSTYVANAEPSMQGMDGDEYQILRIDPDGNRTSLFKSEGLTAFAQDGGDVYATENQKGLIYQMARDGAWLDAPVEIASSLKQPEGIAVGTDGRVLVLEANEDEDHGHNGRLVAVDVSTGAAEVIWDGLGITKELNPTMFQVLEPHATLSQAEDGTIYLFEPGYMQFSMLQPVK